MDIDLISTGCILFMTGFLGYFYFKKRKYLIKNKIPIDPDENIFESFAPKANPESTQDIIKRIDSVFNLETEKNEIKETRYIEEVSILFIGWCLHQPNNFLQINFGRWRHQPIKSNPPSLNFLIQ
jgi:hypothetical protein